MAKLISKKTINLNLAILLSLFVNHAKHVATVHTTLPLTSSFNISLAVLFLCVSRFCCVLSGAVYVYVFVKMFMCMCTCICRVLCVCVRECVVCAVLCVCVCCVCFVVCLCVVCVWLSVRRAKSGETLVEVSRDTNAQIVRHTCFMGAKDKSNNLTVGSLQRFPRRAVT